MTDSVTHGIGHNQPPGDVDHYDSYLDELQKVVTPILEQLNKLVTVQGPRVPASLDTERQAQKAIELAIVLGDLISSVDIVVAQNKKPLDETTRLMRVNNDAWTDKAQALCDRVRAMLSQYMMTADGQSLRTEYGSLAIMARRLEFEVEDAAKVPSDLKVPDKKLITERVKAYAAANADKMSRGEILETLTAVLPGIRVYEKLQLVLKDGRP